MPGSLPEGWRRLAIEEMACQRAEKIRPSRDDQTPYVALEHIPNGGGRLLGADVAGSAMSHKTRFLAGDTLFGKLRPNLRKVVRARFDGVCSTDILAVTPKDGTDAAFLYQLLASDVIYRHVMGDITGTKMPRTSWERLADLSVSCPPLPEQRAIAAVLDAVDDTIERTEAVIAAIEELRRALLHELLTRGVTGMHSEWKHVPGLGAVPVCWEVTTLGECVRSIDYGTNAPLDEAFGGTPVVRMGDLADGDVRTGSLKRANEVLDPDMLITSGDILFNRTNSIDLVGKVGYVDELPGPTSFASYLLRIRVNEWTNSRWLFELLHTPSSQQRLQRMATKGASQANINPTSLKSLPVARPGRREQELVAGLVEALRRAAATEQAHLAGVRTLKVGLANALLSGNLRVPTAEEAPV